MSKPDATITPNKARALRADIKARFAELRADIATIRALRATGRVLDAEDAAGLTAWLWSKHQTLTERRRYLRTARIESLSAMSPRAAARHRARHP